MKKLKNIKLTIAYDGTRFYGWQKQKNIRTVQGTLEKTIQKITRENEIKINGSGRTDAGVHAIGQVANFLTHNSMPVDRWKRVLNHHLPNDVTIKNAKALHQEFHARYSAKSKIYCYCIWNGVDNKKKFNAKQLFYRNYYYFYNRTLDIKKMQKAAKILTGKHDFSALSCVNKKAKNKSKIRILHRLEITRKDTKVFFILEANSFLYKMVRIIIGTLIDYSNYEGNDMNKIEKLLKQKDNHDAGQVIPACGLYLIKVKY